MRILGIDLGSREVKLARMEDGRITERKKFGTMSFYRDYCRHQADGIRVDVDRLGMGAFDFGVSTGYGRNNTDLAAFKPINEVKAHVYGAMWQTGLRDFILLDVGGQDVKVARVEKGLLTDLELNDKCAASCGRYLENMAAVLEIPFAQMADYSEQPVELNATCAVFSESELIGRIAEGVPLERLCAGVNHSMYKRLRPMLTRFADKTLVMLGGVAKGSALRKYLQQDYDEIIVADDPQFNGAIGCCVYGQKKTEKTEGCPHV